MAQRSHGITNTFTAGGAIGANILVKPHSTAGQVVAAAAATDKIIGVAYIADPDGAAAAGEVIDVVQGGIAECRAGGSIAAGDLLTSDASGRVVATTTAGNRIIGVAMKLAASGDIIPVLVSPGSV